MRPVETIDGCLAAHRRLLGDVIELDDAAMRQPSRLPGWTVGHVLTHLARNADSITRRLEGAMRDEVVDQYPGGPQGRAADIDAGAGRGVADIVDDLREAQLAVEQAFEAMPDEAWSRPARDVSGRAAPVEELPFVRWREVAIHHVDLGVGYEPVNWPGELVELLLPWVLPTLAGRADGRSLVAWLIGRGPAPDLGPWR